MNLSHTLHNNFLNGLLLSIFLTLTTLGFSQDYTTKFYNINGNEVPKNQAYFVQIGTIPSGKDHFVGKVIEKYVSSKKIKAKKTFNEVGMQTGVGVEYYPNAQIREKYQLRNGHVYGGYIAWYPNGQKESEREYVEYSASNNVNYLTYNHWDSLGNQKVKDGMGEVIEYYNNYALAAKGRIYKGMRSGTWKGFYKNGNTFYVEKYKNGELIKGTSTLLDSTKYQYTIISQPPSPVKGFPKYYEKMTKALRYPKSAKKIDLQGAVHVAYTINEVGQVIDFYVAKSLSPDCDTEALRLFQEVQVEWIPGTSRGNPKQYVMMLPVTFKL